MFEYYNQGRAGGSRKERDILILAGRAGRQRASEATLSGGACQRMNGTCLTRTTSIKNGENGHYTLACRSSNQIPYSYRQFCQEYTKFVTTTKATMLIKRKPAEILEVDWASSTMGVRDQTTGVVLEVFLFAATLRLLV